VTTEDVLFQHFSVERLALLVVSGETPFGMGNEYTTITRTLHGSEHTVTCRSTLQANIEVALEGTRSVFAVDSFRQLQRAVGFGDTLVFIRKTKLG
jgi:hypothetical protein